MAPSCASSALAITPSEPGRIGTLACFHRLARFFFFAHQPRDFRRRADELDIRGAADLGEVGVLAEQAVAGMNGVDVGDFGGGDDGGNVEIAVGRARRADADGLIGKTNVQRVAVGLAVDGNRAHAEFTAGIEDAKCDFATIGDQNLTKHSVTFEESRASGVSGVSGVSF